MGATGQRGSGREVLKGSSVANAVPCKDVNSKTAHSEEFDPKKEWGRGWVREVGTAIGCEEREGWRFKTDSKHSFTILSGASLCNGSRHVYGWLKFKLPNSIFSRNPTVPTGEDCCLWLQEQLSAGASEEYSLHVSPPDSRPACCQPVRPGQRSSILSEITCNHLQKVSFCSVSTLIVEKHFFLLQLIIVPTFKNFSVAEGAIPQCCLKKNTHIWPY